MWRLRRESREQRRVPRRRVFERGFYTLPADPTMGSSDECGVLDVSVSGAALELYGALPGTGPNQEILVWLESSGDRVVGYELRGQIRNVTRTKFGFVRVGVEFIGLSRKEQAFLESMTEQRSVTA